MSDDPPSGDSSPRERPRSDPRTSDRSGPVPDSGDDDGTAPDPPDDAPAWPEVSAAGLAADGVWKRYEGEGWALRDVTLSVPDRGLHVLAGPNGSGKSTLLSVLAGVTPPDRGRVVREGSVGIGFQRPSVHPTLSVAENLSTFGALTDGDPETVAEQLRLDPVMDRRANRLSGGYQRLLDLALAVGKRPDYLLLDEPLASLDDDSRRRVVSLVAEAARERAVVLVAHQLRAFTEVVDTVAVLVDGEVVTRQPADRIDDLQSWYVEQAGL